MTCWRRLRDWQAAGVWDALHRTLLDRLGEADRSTGAGPAGQRQHPGQKGGELVGPNPTDRGKPGTKRHVVVDRARHPARRAPDRRQPPRLGRLRGAARRHPADQARPTGGAASARASCTPTRPTTSRAAARRCAAATSGSASPARASTPASASGRHRWVVERTLAWLNRFRRLTRPLRAARRHPSGLPHPRLCPHLLQGPPMTGFDRRSKNPVQNGSSSDRVRVQK